MTAATETWCNTLSYCIAVLLQDCILFLCLETHPIKMMPTMLILLHWQRKENKSKWNCNRSLGSCCSFYLVLFWNQYPYLNMAAIWAPQVLWAGNSSVKFLLLFYRRPAVCSLQILPKLSVFLGLMLLLDRSKSLLHTWLMEFCH